VLYTVFQYIIVFKWTHFTTANNYEFVRNVVSHMSYLVEKVEPFYLGIEVFNLLLFNKEYFSL